MLPEFSNNSSEKTIQINHTKVFKVTNSADHKDKFQVTFICSKPAIETLEKGVKYVKS